jgi:hypothetical protein
MSGKYRIASSAMFFKMLGTLILTPAISRLDCAALKKINENARESDSFAEVSVSIIRYEPKSSP